MKLSKAIEILDTHQCDLPRNKVPDLIDAIKLGINALIREQSNRINPHFVSIGILPGETPDDPPPNSLDPCEDLKG